MGLKKLSVGDRIKMPVGMKPATYIEAMGTYTEDTTVDNKAFTTEQDFLAATGAELGLVTSIDGGTKKKDIRIRLLRDPTGSSGVTIRDGADEMTQVKLRRCSFFR